MLAEFPRNFPKSAAACYVATIAVYTSAISLLKTPCMHHDKRIASLSTNADSFAYYKSSFRKSCANDFIQEDYSRCCLTRIVLQRHSNQENRGKDADFCRHTNLLQT